MHGSGPKARDTKFVANGAAKCFLDFSMTWDSRTSAVDRISVDRVFAAFAIQATAMSLDVTDQVATFHSVGTSTVSVSQIALAVAVLAAFAW